MKYTLLIVLLSVLTAGCSDKIEDKKSVVKVILKSENLPERADTITINYYEYLYLNGMNLYDGNGNGKCYDVVRFSILK